MFIFFYTTQCEHCRDIRTTLEALEVHEDLPVQFLNVEKKGEAQDLYNAVDNVAGCGGVPLLYHEPTSRSLCGGVGEETLRAFIKECLAEQDNLKISR
jgi:glutaredoxin